MAVHLVTQRIILADRETQPTHQEARPLGEKSFKLPRIRTSGQTRPTDFEVRTMAKDMVTEVRKPTADRTRSTHLNVLPLEVHSFT